MRCPRCGARSSGASWYCRSCGSAFTDLNVADSIGRRRGNPAPWLVLAGLVAMGAAGYWWTGVRSRQPAPQVAMSTPRVLPPPTLAAVATPSNEPSVFGAMRPTPIVTPDPLSTTEPGFQNARPESPPEVSFDAQPALAGPTLDPRSYPVGAGPLSLATPSRARPDAPVWRIPYRSEPPTLDGGLDEWAGAPMALGSVVFGREHWSGQADLDAAAFGAWNVRYLFLGVRVTDDTFSQPSQGESLFLGDSLEIQLDADLERDWSGDRYDADDWQIGISPGDFGSRKPEAFIWRPELHDAGGIQIGSRRLDEGYAIEVAIPWALLGVDTGRTRAVGLAFNVSDDDLPQPAQMTMLSSSPNRAYDDPRSFGTLVLDSGLGGS